MCALTHGLYEWRAFPFPAALSRARAAFRKTLLATSMKLRAEAEAQKKDIEKEMEEEERRILEQVRTCSLKPR